MKNIQKISKNRNKIYYCCYCGAPKRSDALKSHQQVCLARAERAIQKKKEKELKKILQAKKKEEQKIKKALETAKLIEIYRARAW